MVSLPPPSCLPVSGRLACAVCHGGGSTIFDETRRTAEDGQWRITANPMAWGNPNAEVVVLGFSKGPSQTERLAEMRHDDIPYRKGRVPVGKILAHVGLIEGGDNKHLRAAVDRLIADRGGRFHFGSLIRCTVERREGDGWKGTGGDMLGGFVGTSFGDEVATNCARRFLGRLPSSTRLVVLFGMGKKQKYIGEARNLIARARPGRWRTINEVAYADDQITVVHVEHFVAQGNLLPRWLGEGGHSRARFGIQAREAVAAALGHDVRVGAQ